MEIVLNLGLLIIGFIMLIKGADWFVDGASKIADHFGIPQIVIGLTIVAFGTSAPEAAISINGALKGNGGITIGNVVGSNILNILLILGITSLIIPLSIQKTTLKYEVPYVIFVSCVLYALGIDGSIHFKDGMILWGLFIIFFIYLSILSKKKNIEVSEKDKEVKGWISVLSFTIIGIAFIIIGSDLTVDSATNIAFILKVSERIVGLTIIAFGTSLPELITSVTAGLKGKDDIAIGNIVGSNIFNILFVTGTAALITPIEYSSEFGIDSMICIASGILLFLSVFREKKLKRIGGIFMLLLYGGYFFYLIQQ
ncbi:sodium:calcium antiporter [bacterium 1XD42-8]|jgi:cation:H+ antiporter|nr:calcium/sodium antiporter [Lachnospiraceae bacterium]RKJ42759.1 sodium:calcium antiporter [bacterium 1XD42-8]